MSLAGILQSILTTLHWWISLRNVINDTSPCLQKLMLRLPQYQMDVKYVMQKCVPIVDCMSRLINSKTGVEDPTLNLQIADVTRTNVNWDQIKISCLDDPTMIQLARIIRRGWLDTAKDVPVDVKPYFQYRYILHIVNGVIFLQRQDCHSHGPKKCLSSEDSWSSSGNCEIQFAWPDIVLLA